ncbi:unnamed protein product [Leptidea sinapis]|uniref:Uncharacterized protein n=1 Tax=Leptidea sinapis TaxID=189913 RepID=A0A5E4PR39_9NEOP|nr:unnamed protein product [Leptidea sinapis]
MILADKSGYELDNFQMSDPSDIHTTIRTDDNERPSSSSPDVVEIRIPHICITISDEESNESRAAVRTPLPDTERSSSPDVVEIRIPHECIVISDEESNNEALRDRLVFGSSDLDCQKKVIKIGDQSLEEVIDAC